MILLGADTSTTGASVCICENGELIAARYRNPGQTHSRHLMDMIAGALADAGLVIRDLDGLFVGVGPGSFTGVRIGVSTMKGLAQAANLPISPVTSLALMAARCRLHDGPVCVMLDARRKEVYSQTFQIKEGIPLPVSDAVVAPPAAILSGMKKDTVFLGSGAFLYSDLIAEMGNGAFSLYRTDCLHPDIREAVPVMASSWDGIKLTDPAKLLPLYLRKSDAELHFEEKKKG